MSKNASILGKSALEGIDPRNPESLQAGLTALFSQHRSRSGNLVMEVTEGTEGAQGGDGGDGGDNGGDGGDGGKPDESTGTPPEGSEPEFNAEEYTPEKIQALLAERNDFEGKYKDADAKARIAKRDAEKLAAKTANEKLAEFMKSLDPDYKPEETANPKEVVDKVTSELASTKAELAVVRLAGKLGADGDELLNLKSFDKELAKVDVSDSEAVKKVITDFLTANPKFKVVQSASKSGPSSRQGDEGKKEPKTLAEAIALEDAAKSK